MPKKKKAVRLPRRSSFDAALDHATKKLERSIARQAVLEAELDTLRKDIPYLQSVIRALKPVHVTAVNHWPSGIATSATTPLPHIVGSVPESVKPFMEPITVDELLGEEDSFLDVRIPGEREVLP